MVFVSFPPYDLELEHKEEEAVPVQLPVRLVGVGILLGYSSHDLELESKEEAVPVHLPVELVRVVMLLG